MFKRIVAGVEVFALASFVVMVALLVLEQPSKNLTALPPTTTVPAGQTATTGVPDGAKLYKSNCAGCHGGDGGGGIGPQLRDGAVLRAFEDAADESAYISRGGGGMPSFENRFTEAEIQAVVEFTRTVLQK